MSLMHGATMMFSTPNCKRQPQDKHKSKHPVTVCISWKIKCLNSGYYSETGLMNIVYIGCFIISL